MVKPKLVAVADPSGGRKDATGEADQLSGDLLEEIVQDRTMALQRELDDLQAQIAGLAAALEEKPEYGLGRGDPAITRWELDRALLERLENRAASLRRALSRLDQGTYGICAQCGRTIHPDRLEVLPDVAVCIRCARAGELEMPASSPGDRHLDNRLSEAECVPSHKRDTG